MSKKLQGKNKNMLYALGAALGTAAVATLVVNKKKKNNKNSDNNKNYNSIDTEL